MVYKVLFAGDLHKRMRDISTIKGYVNVTTKIQINLIQTIKKEGITHFVSCGDWYDKGYGSDIPSAFSHAELDRVMSEFLHGNFYGVVGNHLRLSMDSNPELSLIQPSDKFKARIPIPRREPIIKTPDSFILNGVQISLFHNNYLDDRVENYVNSIDDQEIKYHIGVYHSDIAIPLQMLNNPQPYFESVGNKLDYMYKNVDYAIIGHYHNPLKDFTYCGLDNHKTLISVPGSLMVTAINQIKKSFVEAPLVTIYEDGSIEITKLKIPTFVEELEFKEVVTPEDTLKSIRGNAIDELYESNELSSILISKEESLFSLAKFMEFKGYSKSDKDLVKLVIDNPEDIEQMISVFNLNEFSIDDDEEEN